MVSELRSVIAVSLNADGDVRLIKPAKLHVHAKHYKHTEDGRTAPDVCAVVPGNAEPLGERRYENWNTHTRAHTHTHTQNENGSKAYRVLFLNIYIQCVSMFADYITLFIKWAKAAEITEI